MKFGFERFFAAIKINLRFQLVSSGSSASANVGGELLEGRKVSGELQTRCVRACVYR